MRQRSIDLKEGLCLKIQPTKSTSFKAFYPLYKLTTASGRWANFSSKTDSLCTVETDLVAQAGHLTHHILLILKTSALGRGARHGFPIVFAVDSRKSWQSLLFKLGKTL